MCRRLGSYSLVGVNMYGFGRWVGAGHGGQASFPVAGVHNKCIMNFLHFVIPKQLQILNPLAPGVRMGGSDKRQGTYNLFLIVLWEDFLSNDSAHYLKSEARLPTYLLRMNKDPCLMKPQLTLFFSWNSYFLYPRLPSNSLCSQGWDPVSVVLGSSTRQALCQPTTHPHLHFLGHVSLCGLVHSILITILPCLQRGHDCLQLLANRLTFSHVS